MERGLESEMENGTTATPGSLLDFWPQVLLIVLAAVVIGIFIGVQIAKKQITPHKKIHISMEYSIMVLSGIITICAIFFQTFNMLENFSSAVITAFSGVIFSWLLTKMSSKEEWEKREQELARRSYRHIDYIESASKSAEQMINQYIQGDRKDEIEDKERLIFSGVMDYIGYISGGINTCKMDWYDLMSPEEQEKFSSKEPINRSVSTSDMIFINQEDA